jgi:hypothetical protein
MPNGDISLIWGDGEHKFNIAKIGQVLELEEKCGAGIATILNRLRTGTFYVNDFRETLRLGLIGGGMAPPVAMRMIRRYLDERPWQESVLPAMHVIAAAMVGVPGDEVGKKPTADQTATETTKMPETAVSSDPLYMLQDAPSASPPDKSTNLQSGNSAPVSTDSIAPTA